MLEQENIRSHTKISKNQNHCNFFFPSSFDASQENLWWIKMSFLCKILKTPGHHPRAIYPSFCSKIAEDGVLPQGSDFFLGSGSLHWPQYSIQMVRWITHEGDSFGTQSIPMIVLPHKKCTLFGKKENKVKWLKGSWGSQSVNSYLEALPHQSDPKNHWIPAYILHFHWG